MSRSRVAGKYVAVCISCDFTAQADIGAVTLQVEARIGKQTLQTIRQANAPKLSAAQKSLDTVPANPTIVSVLFSSVSSVAGNTGHANYAAANSALDSFATYQNSAGINTISVQWGAWLSVGEVIVQVESLRLSACCQTDSGSVLPKTCPGMAHKQLRVSKIQSFGIGMVTSESGLAALHTGMTTAAWHAMPVIGFVPKNYWRMLLANVRDIPRVFGDLDIKVQQSSAVVASSNKRDANVHSTLLTSPAHIAMSVKQLVSEVLRNQTVDPHEPLAYQGMDSLARLELRQKIQVTGWCQGMCT